MSRVTLGPVSLRLKSEEFNHIVRIGAEGILYFKTYLAGEWIDGDRWLSVRSPIDLSIIAKVPQLSAEGVSNVIEKVYVDGRSRARNTPGAKRLKILHRVADLIEEKADDFVNSLVINSGKSQHSAEAEVRASIDRLRMTELDTKKIYGDYIPGDWSSETLETEAIVKREPLGVVLIITPFNYPLFDAVNKISYSFLAGNAIIIKPASSDPIPVLLLTRLLELAGYPPEAIAVLTIPGKEMKYIISDRRISAISLTGSSETGVKVLKEAGIKQFIMELGGGDPAIVLSDADVKWAAKRIARGIYSYAGQRCDAIKIILAEEDIYDSLKDLLVKELNSVKVGDPRKADVDVGPLIDPSVADEMMRSIEDAKTKGGNILVGGKRLGPTYVEPTLIEIPKDRIKTTYLYQKEVFAPIALITSVSSIDEAINLSNGRPYGLDAAIFGKNINKIRKAIRLLEVGAVYINDYPRHGIGYYPFGGRKDSGIGREGIGYAIEYITAYKSIVYNFKGAGIWEYL